MFSGKSTELIRRVHRYRYAGHKCVLVKHSSDTRYSRAGSIITHDRASTPAYITESLFSLNIPSDTSVIGIDEGQFVSLLLLLLFFTLFCWNFFLFSLKVSRNCGVFWNHGIKEGKSCYRRRIDCHLWAKTISSHGSFIGVRGKSCQNEICLSKLQIWKRKFYNEACKTFQFNRIGWRFWKLYGSLQKMSSIFLNFFACGKKAKRGWSTIRRY